MTAFSLQRVRVGKKYVSYCNHIIGPDGRQYGPTFGDIGGPREAEPWLAALEAAYDLNADDTTVRRPIKTDREIVDECNALALTFCEMDGFNVEPGHKFYKEDGARIEKWWALATAAYDHIEGTDVQDIIDNLEEE